MTPVWVAIGGAISLLVAQWATGRLFKRLLDIEEAIQQIKAHQRGTDARVEEINHNGSHRHDNIQNQYWSMSERIKVLETLESVKKELQRRRNEGPD